MGSPLTYCSRCGTMVGGRHPSDSGTFTAGFEPICNDCAESSGGAGKDPSSGSRPAMSQEQLDAAIPERAATPPPPAAQPHTHGHVHPKKTHRRRSMRFARRSSGTNTAIIVVGVVIAIGVLLALIVAASK